MVDLDKFICSLFNNGYGTISMGDIKVALKNQGLEYKEGAIKPIESKPDTLALEKIEKHTLSSIFKGEWYICIKPINYFTVGKIYYAIKDWVLRGDLGYTVDVKWTSDCFRPATKEDIEKQTTRLNPSTIEMLEKPSTIKFDEPDFERMEAEYCTTLDTPNGVLDAIVQSKMCSAYRKGLEDMWRELKEE